MPVPPKTVQRVFLNHNDIIKPDINAYYAKLANIDIFRSTFSAVTSNIQQSISLDKLDRVFKDNDASSRDKQESRCNAFYRMLGLPIINGEGSSLYSPGFDPDRNRDKVQTEFNLNIANSLLKKVGKILDAREIYSIMSTNIFKNRDESATITAMSIMYPRPFERQIKQGKGPLEAEIDEQVFEVPQRNTFLSIFPKTPDVVAVATKSRHFLKPFVVDPRIDLTVNPAANRICVPFLLDKSTTQLYRGAYLKRPYIEIVITKRLQKINVASKPGDKKEINAFIDNLVQFIKSNQSITDTKSIDNIYNMLQSLHSSETVKFAKYVQIIEALLINLSNSVTELEKIRTQINWKPIPNLRGPEFGCQLKEVDPQDTINNKEREQNIIKTERDKFISQTDLTVGINNPNLVDYAFSDDDVAMAEIEKNYQHYDEQIHKLNGIRNGYGNKANDLLRKIEIITGEVSGFGLLDMYAILAALWAVEETALIGMLDFNARIRMTNNTDIIVDFANVDVPIDALQKFEKKVSEIYVLMGSFYETIRKEGR